MSTQVTPPKVDELPVAFEKDFSQAGCLQMPWKNALKPETYCQEGHPDFPAFQNETQLFGKECIPAKDVSTGSCSTTTNVEATYNTPPQATDSISINASRTINSTERTSSRGVKPEVDYPNLGPVPASQILNGTEEMHNFDNAASTGSNGVVIDNEKCTQPGSLLANALGEALPGIIDRTGCTQTALGKLFEEDLMIRTISILGVDQSQLLMHLLKNSSEYLMKNGKRRKGKGGRRPAADPRIDPNIDPKKAKRIVANRKSAAKSKEKQRREATSLKIQHDTRLCQLSAIAFEIQYQEYSMNSNFPVESKLEETCCTFMETDQRMVSIRSSTSNALLDDQYMNCSGQAAVPNGTYDCSEFHASPTPGSEFGTHYCGSESSYMKLPATFTLQSQFAFGASTPMTTLEESNNQDFLWDFGLEGDEMDITNWNVW